MKRAHVLGLFFSITNSVAFFALAALFALGTDLINQNKLTLEEILQ